ncbi:MAG: non-hydrolyzing UDP-N-acetylglucosamine 2-epimerase [Desulfobacteraceae bacterium]
MAKKLKWLIVAGARPNFVKIAPLIRAIENYNANHALSKAEVIPVIVHTGQHYDQAMSKVFFDQLNIPQPDINLGIGSGSHGEQTGRIMIAFENVIIEQKPDLVIVVGDVNSTIACALVAAKLNIPVAHVEAGLRSFDRSMPEEINRILTDQISDFLFTHSRNADENLLTEGVSKEKIFFVGNIMIDSLRLILPYTSSAITTTKLNALLSQNGAPSAYGLLTLHRPATVDSKAQLETVLNTISEISRNLPIIFPIHPRTRKQVISYGLADKLNWLTEDLQLTNGKGKNFIYAPPPLGYLDFIALMEKARVVFTDSGGAQEETTIMGVPCITLRENTERPITITEGTNTLAGTDPIKITKAFAKAVASEQVERRIPELWDGKTAERIISILASKFL